MTQRIDLPAIYCISEGRLTDENFHAASHHLLSQVRAAASSDVSMFQIREKALSDSRLFDLASQAVRAARNSHLKIIVNGRADIALAAGADGVHLPANGVPTDAVRKWVPDEFIIGVSTHSLEEAILAREGGADFAVFGPVFETPGKGPAVGIDALKNVCDAVAPFPVLALGGINEENAGEALAAGASGYAAITYLHRNISESDRTGS
ncbi:MAG: thiamine phosphate synthase [Chloracidobacterium sp.]|nr:thiamine phosphate synthase [Chloracidobacterium sp.]